MQQGIYFRPEWVCGRYNREKRAAIFYNLIEGMSYFFEDYSADIIGAILTAPRNGAIYISKISEETGLSIENLTPFAKELVRLNLLTDNPMDKDAIVSYRRASAMKKREMLAVERPTLLKIPFRDEDAETSYLRKVGGITQAMFELTYNCSEKCIHCYNIGATRNDLEKSHRGEFQELTLDDYKNIIDQLYDAGCFKIVLSGGDPFSKPNIWEIIQYIFDKGIAFDIYTNAQALVNKVERIVDFYPRLMSISLYGDNAATHDQITRLPGSWERTVSVMNKLGDYSVPMDIKVCIMRPNIKHYRGTIEIAQKAGGMALFEASLNDSIEGDKCVSKYLRLTPEEYEIILRDDNIGLYVGKEAPEYGKQVHFPDRPMCEGGHAAICIDPEGSVMPCTAFHLKFGNLKVNTLKDILENSEVLKKWQNSTLKDTTECMKHDYCEYCILCPGKAFAEHGTWLEPAENCCYIAKLRHKVATDLKNGKDPLNGRSIDECIEQLPEFKMPKLHRVL